MASSQAPAAHNVGNDDRRIHDMKRSRAMAYRARVAGRTLAAASRGTCKRASVASVSFSICGVWPCDDEGRAAFTKVRRPERPRCKLALGRLVAPEVPQGRDLAI